MVKQLSKHQLELLLEYPDSSIDRVRGNESLRGKQRNFNRPAYITVICHANEHTFNFNAEVKQLIYGDLPLVLDGQSKTYKRIICKPYWFYKLVEKG